MTMRRTLIGVVLAVTLIACGSDDGNGVTTDVDVTDATVATDAVAATDPETTDAPPRSDPVAANPPPATETVTSEPDRSFTDVAGLATIELQATDAGAQPMLAWTPADGAASYHVVALTSDGAPYWGWSGAKTEVRFGGAPDGGGQTAVVFEPLTWRVVALDADGVPVAIGGPGELTP